MTMDTDIGEVQVWSSGVLTPLPPQVLPIDAPTVHGIAVVTPPTDQVLSLDGLGANGTATVTVPPPVLLPPPPFVDWLDAVTYARGMFARLRYMESQLQPLSEAVGAAQIALAAAEHELVALQAAATDLLAQGKGLA